MKKRQQRLSARGVRARQSKFSGCAGRGDRPRKARRAAHTPALRLRLWHCRPLARKPFRPGLEARQWTLAPSGGVCRRVRRSRVGFRVSPPAPNGERAGGPPMRGVAAPRPAGRGNAGMYHAEGAKFVQMRIRCPVRAAVEPAPWGTRILRRRIRTQGSELKDQNSKETQLKRR
jgi:hypothetical protein